MKKVKKATKSFISLLIVMLGAYLMSFFIQNETSFTSVFCGIMGFIIISPAFEKWEEVLWGKNDTDANQS